jgi:hypothetical protein
VSEPQVENLSAIKRMTACRKLSLEARRPKTRSERTPSLYNSVTNQPEEKTESNFRPCEPAQRKTLVEPSSVLPIKQVASLESSLYPGPELVQDMSIRKSIKLSSSSSSMTGRMFEQQQIPHGFSRSMMPQHTRKAKNIEVEQKPRLERPITRIAASKTPPDSRQPIRSSSPALDNVTTELSISQKVTPRSAHRSYISEAEAETGCDYESLVAKLRRSMSGKESSKSPLLLPEEIIESAKFCSTTRQQQPRITESNHVEPVNNEFVPSATCMRRALTEPPPPTPEFDIEEEMLPEPDVFGSIPGLELPNIRRLSLEPSARHVSTHQSIEQIPFLGPVGREHTQRYIESPFIPGNDTQRTMKWKCTDMEGEQRTSLSSLSADAEFFVDDIKPEARPNISALGPLLSVSGATDASSGDRTLTPGVQDPQTLVITNQPHMRRLSSQAEQRVLPESSLAYVSSSSPITEDNQIYGELVQPRKEELEDMSLITPAEEVPQPIMAVQLPREEFRRQSIHREFHMVRSDPTAPEIEQPSIPQATTRQPSHLHRKRTPRVLKPHEKSLTESNMVSLLSSPQLTRQLNEPQMRLLPIPQQPTIRSRETSNCRISKHEMSRLIQCNLEESIDLEREEPMIERQPSEHHTGVTARKLSGCDSTYHSGLGKLAYYESLSEHSVSNQEPQLVVEKRYKTSIQDTVSLARHDTMLGELSEVESMQQIQDHPASLEQIQTRTTSLNIPVMLIAGMSQGAQSENTERHVSISSKSERDSEALELAPSWWLSEAHEEEESFREVIYAPTATHQLVDLKQPEQPAPSSSTPPTVLSRVNCVPTQESNLVENALTPISRHATIRHSDPHCPTRTFPATVQERQQRDPEPEVGPDIEPVQEPTVTQDSARAPLLDEPLATYDVYNASSLPTPKSVVSAPHIIPTTRAREQESCPNALFVPEIAQRKEQFESTMPTEFIEKHEPSRYDERVSMALLSHDSKPLGSQFFCKDIEGMSRESHGPDFQMTSFDPKVDHRVQSNMIISPSRSERPRKVSVAPGIEIVPPKLVQRSSEHTQVGKRPRKVANYAPDQQHPVAPAYPLRETPPWTRPDTQIPPSKPQSAGLESKKRGLLHWGAKSKKDLQLRKSSHAQSKIHIHRTPDKYAQHKAIQPVSVRPKGKLQSARLNSNSLGQKPSCAFELRGQQCAPIPTRNYNSPVRAATLYAGKTDYYPRLVPLIDDRTRDYAKA